jgi:SAM-dependent methyltransferase
MKLTDFEKRSDTRVFCHGDSSTFEYSDGETVERNILKSIKSCEDVSCFSSELLAHIVDWPTEYHFSPARHNLLRHVPFRPSMKILEIGAGCGAITRQLGESGADVCSVEGSYIRASCVAERCRDLKNVNVYCANFKNVHIEDQYDFVLLIGALEYANEYFGSIENCLQKAQLALKQDGVLIIAIENQLGLKYFSGLSEDHVGIPYFGIEDRYNQDGVQTLGKREINRRIKGSGFNFIDFQFPFPDYKIPQVILTESAFEAESFQVSNLLYSIKHRDYSDKHTPKIRCKYVYPVLERNHLIQDLSNSFLIFASRDDHAEHRQFLSQPLGYKYTTSRRKELCTRTTFQVNKQDRILVKKTRILDLPQASSAVMQYQDKDAAYVHGQNLDFLIDNAMHQGNITRAKELISLWVGFLNTSAAEVSMGEKWQSTPLRSNMIDAMPKNFQVADDRLYLIDLEWSYGGKFTAKFLWTKYLIDKLSVEREWNLQLVFANKPISVETLSAEFDFDLNEADFLEYNRIENQIGKDVFDKKMETLTTPAQLNELLNSQTSTLKMAEQYPFYRWQEEPLNRLRMVFHTSFSTLGRIRRRMKFYLKERLE